MKVVKRKDKKISISELVKNFNKYIIVANKEECIYVLINWVEDFVWINLRDNGIWDECSNVSAALQAVDIEELYAFDSYRDFAEWLEKIKKD